MKGKVIILSAPSGSGKSTIIKNLMKENPLNLKFSISATSRKPREGETHGKDYYFLTEEEFEQNIKDGNFVEWEEVYAGVRYGTLESEIERILQTGNNVIMDIDVKGALNVKKRYGKKALLLFIMPPSLDALAERLRARGTDSEENIIKRLDKAEYEIGFADMFDTTILNDELEVAIRSTENKIREFLKE